MTLFPSNCARLHSHLATHARRYCHYDHWETAVFSGPRMQTHAHTDAHRRRLLPLPSPQNAIVTIPSLKHFLSSTHNALAVQTENFSHQPQRAREDNVPRILVLEGTARPHADFRTLFQTAMSEDRCGAAPWSDFKVMGNVYPFFLFASILAAFPGCNGFKGQEDDLTCSRR